MPISSRPWRRTATFDRPRIRRLTAPQLRAWRGYLAEARRLRLLSPGRMDAALAVLQLVGWRGAQQLALAVLAAAANVSVDTCHRALADLERLGLVRRHHMLRRGADRRTRQDASVIELLPAPASDPQPAGGRIPEGIKVLFLTAKRAKYWGDLAGRAVRKMLWNKSTGPIGGDDAWGRASAQRQLMALGVAG